MLPLVQFYLEEGVGDEEAVSLIDLEVPPADRRDARWQDVDHGGILLSARAASLRVFAWRFFRATV